MPHISTTNTSLWIYLYRLAEIKAMKTGKVSRLLKQNAIDCVLNKGQSNFTVENEQTVKQSLSNGIETDWKVGDKPFTALCDYMDTCSYQCKPNKDVLETNYDTYNENFISLNIEKIMEKIKEIFKEQYVLEKDKLVRTINYVKEYPLVQIYSALDRLLNDETEIIFDMFGKKGNLINIGNYYLFQPIEIKDKTISIYDRARAIHFKHPKIKVGLPKNINNLLETDKATTTETKEDDDIKKSEKISEKIKELEEKYHCYNL